MGHFPPNQPNWVFLVSFFRHSNVFELLTPEVDQTTDLQTTAHVHQAKDKARCM